MTSLLADLERRLTGHVSVQPGDLDDHARDLNWPDRGTPAAVVYAASVADVQAAVEWADATGTPLVAWGAGSSAEGQVIADYGQVILDLSGLNGPVDVRPGDFEAACPAGVRRSEVDRAARRHGLMFTVDPGADATIGGMAATNASGTTTVRYGDMRSNVVCLRYVDAHGRVHRAGRPVAKTSSGYSLKDLLVGAAGTLGVIVEVTVRLHPVPAAIHAQRTSFPDITHAVRAAADTMEHALAVARLELADAASVRALNTVRGRDWPVAPALLVELHGSDPESLRLEVAALDSIMRRHGGNSTEVAATPSTQRALWDDRHGMFLAAMNQHPAHTYVITDTVVPMSSLPAAVEHASARAAALRLDVVVGGHIGDGNVHTLVCVAPGQDDAAATYSDELVRWALAHDGSATGEHGIGLAKKKYLALEHGDAVDQMRAVKRALDPNGIFNPGKIFDR